MRRLIIDMRDKIFIGKLNCAMRGWGLENGRERNQEPRGEEQIRRPRVQQIPCLKWLRLYRNQRLGEGKWCSGTGLVEGKERAGWEVLRIQDSVTVTTEQILEILRKTVGQHPLWYIKWASQAFVLNLRANTCNFWIHLVVSWRTDPRQIRQYELAGYQPRTIVWF